MQCGVICDTYMTHQTCDTGITQWFMGMHACTVPFLPSAGRRGGSRVLVNRLTASVTLEQRIQGSFCVGRSQLNVSSTYHSPFFPPSLTCPDTWYMPSSVLMMARVSIRSSPSPSTGHLVIHSTASLGRDQKSLCEIRNHG